MGKKQWLVALIGIVVVVAIYAFGERVVQASDAPAVKMANDAAKMSGTTASATSFSSILKQVKKNQPSDVQMRLTRIEGTVTRGNVKEQKVRAYGQLAAVWDSLGQVAIAAHYKGEQGKLENSEKSLTFAAFLLLRDQEKTEDPGIRQWKIQDAKGFLEKAENIDPNSDSVQVGLAQVDVASGEVMQGVQKLLKVTKKDPNNIAANMTLGRLSITSGQFMKAVDRLQIVVDQQPHNVEALYYLAEAYKNTGKKDKAIKIFEKCKELVDDPGFDKEIDNYIKKFK